MSEFFGAAILRWALQLKPQGCTGEEAIKAIRLIGKKIQKGVYQLKALPSLEEFLFGSK